MNESEQELLSNLEAITTCVRRHDPWWSNKFADDRLQAENLFYRQTEIADRYKLVRRLLSYYESGMGGLHEVVPEQCLKPKHALFESTEKLLRMYWKELGREWHDYSQFKLIPIGASVRLIPGKVMYQRPDFPATVVSDTEEVTKEVWLIVKCTGPDITNMPSYLIQNSSSIGSARHEALEIIKDDRVS